MVLILDGAQKIGLFEKNLICDCLDLIKSLKTVQITDIAPYVCNISSQFLG